MPSEPNTTTILGSGTVGSTYGETWVSGGVLHSTHTIMCDAVNGIAPIKCKSATLCVNLNAHMVGGATRDEILSVASLRKIVDALNLCLAHAGATDNELLVLPELEIGENFVTIGETPTYAGIGQATDTAVRFDRDPDLTSANLVARYGGNVAANESVVPSSIDAIVGDSD